MKKVININFQGRVIPIEETAHDLLTQYVDSLRRFFANEEGRDEIINDIESRVAELFSDMLKKGSTCITDADVNVVIDSMGRPEDFDDDENRVKSQLENEGRANTGDFSQPRGRLFRDENDKILGGVCAGIAHYLRIDPAIVRILFAIISFGGFGTGIIIYILLWIVVPSRGLEKSAIRKRLFRNPDDRVIAGVASGVASYFNIAVWIPRVVFAFPLVAGLCISIFRNIFWNFDPFPSIVFGSFGGTLFIVYIVLWMIIPEANSASEKLEMRGEKVDLNTIKNTIQEDLEGFRNRAENWGKEFGSKAQQWGQDVGKTMSEKKIFERASATGSETGNYVRRRGSRIGHAIGVIFKAFFLFIAGILAFALLMALLALIFSGVSVFPLKNYFLEGFGQNTLAWFTLLFFLGVPVVAFITWIIRRIMGIRPGSRSLGWIFGGLWVIGLISAIVLAASIARSFDADAREKVDLPMTQPSSGKVIVQVADANIKTYGRWFHMDGIVNVTEDSLVINNVRFHIVKSPDTAFHMYMTKYSSGRDEDNALTNVKGVHYGITQQDSVLILDRGFAVKKGTKFRNQRVIATLQIPIGRHIMIDRSVSRRLNWFSFNNGHRNNDEWDEDWNDQYWDSNVEYIMTPGGLERADKATKSEEDDSNTQDELKSIEDQQKELDQRKKELLKDSTDSLRYHYKAPATNKPAKPSTPVTKKSVADASDNNGSQIKQSIRSKTEAIFKKAAGMNNTDVEISTNPFTLILTKFLSR
ncbi:MAG: hypothetical protein JWN76_1324 [Chitinophagaceae bacterium]|nr:hypothetical protein [Chitinophagaceae bacterium]